MELTFTEVYISHQMKTKPWILNKTWITVDLPVWPYLAENAKSGRFHYRTSTNTWTWEITTFVEIQMEVATHKILTSPLLKKVLHAGQRGRVLQCFHNPVRRRICCCERLKIFLSRRVNDWRWWGLNTEPNKEPSWQYQGYQVPRLY